MENIILPLSQAIIVDDVGWFNGDDERMKNGSARSGIPRFHAPSDVRALNAIAEGLGTKIGCSLVLGEWDINNRLRGVPHVTANPEKWDVKSKIDMDYARAYFEALEESAGLEYYVHGLMHAYYIEGRLHTARQYYPTIFDENKKDIGFVWLPKEEFHRMIELFYEIYNDWGFKKELKTFVSPCGCRGAIDAEGNLEYAEVLRSFGIEVWANGWVDHKPNVDTIGGMITSKGRCIAPWNGYGINPKYLAPLDDSRLDTHLGAHLANFIRFNPEDNFEYVDAWIKYFRDVTRMFGRMLARDNADSASQSLYSRFAKVEKCDGGYIIDLSEVDALCAVGRRNEFFVSFKDAVAPKTISGGEISLYETHEGYKTYKITREGSSEVKISV